MPVIRSSGDHAYAAIERLRVRVEALERKVAKLEKKAKKKGGTQWMTETSDSRCPSEATI